MGGLHPNPDPRVLLPSAGPCFEPRDANLRRGGAVSGCEALTGVAVEGRRTGGIVIRSPAMVAGHDPKASCFSYAPYQRRLCSS